MIIILMVEKTTYSITPDIGTLLHFLCRYPNVWQWNWSVENGPEGFNKIMPPKKQQWLVMFHPDYKRSFPYIDESKKGEHFAFSKMCRADINIGHGAQKDISLHKKN